METRQATTLVHDWGKRLEPLVKTKLGTLRRKYTDAVFSIAGREMPNATDIRTYFGLILSGFNCEQIEKIGFVMLRAVGKLGDYSDFRMLNKKSAIRVLTELIVAAPVFLNDMKSFTLEEQYVAFFQRMVVAYDATEEHIKSNMDRQHTVCLGDETRVLGAGFCPPGYRRRGQSTCCERDPTASRPFAWSLYMEKDVLEKMYKTMAEVTRITLQRKILQESSSLLKPRYGCDDTDEVQLWYAMAYASKQKVAELASNMAKKFASFTRTPEQLKSIKKAVVAVFDIIQGKFTQLLMDKFKIRFVEIVTDFIVRTGMLNNLKVRPESGRRNFRYDFSVLLTSEPVYKGIPRVADALYRAFEKYESRKSFLHGTMFSLFDTFSESIMDELQAVLSETSRLPAVFFNQLKGLLKETSLEATEIVLALFLFTKLDDPSTDIFKVIVKVFDLSEALLEHPYVVANYPIVVEWAQAIQAQAVTPEKRTAITSNVNSLDAIKQNLNGFVNCVSRTVDNKSSFIDCAAGAPVPVAVPKPKLRKTPSRRRPMSR